MNDEQIKEITIVMIQNDFLYLDGETNEEVAKQIAEFVNTLKYETTENARQYNS